MEGKTLGLPGPCLLACLLCADHQHQQERVCLLPRERTLASSPAPLNSAYCAPPPPSFPGGLVLSCLPMSCSTGPVPWTPTIRYTGDFHLSFWGFGVWKSLDSAFSSLETIHSATSSLSLFPQPLHCSSFLSLCTPCWSSTGCNITVFLPDTEPDHWNWPNLLPTRQAYVCTCIHF